MDTKKGGTKRVLPHIFYHESVLVKCSVPYTEDGWYIWLGKLVDAGKIIGKGADAIAMRFADGLPEFAGTLANDIRKIVNAKSLLFPATYGASVTRIYPPKWAARAIPHAGGCDYYGLADQHRLQWIKSCKGVRMAVSSFMLHLLGSGVLRYPRVHRHAVRLPDAAGEVRAG